MFATFAAMKQCFSYPYSCIVSKVELTKMIELAEKGEVKFLIFIFLKLDKLNNMLGYLMKKVLLFFVFVFSSFTVHADRYCDVLRNNGY